MWSLADRELGSRLLLGSAQYPSPAIMEQSIAASGAEVVTVALRRQQPETGAGRDFWQRLKSLGLHLLPNTAGCHTAKSAITTALMARELFDTHWIKLEVIGDDYNLQPDPFALLEAARELVGQGFEVFPYCTDDLVLAERLVQAGCRILMPWAAPIGTGRGLVNPYGLRCLRARLPDITLIVDAGIGTPSHATRALEMGYDAVLLNTAVAQAEDPVMMARAFRAAVEAGYLARQAGPVPRRELAVASTPVVGKPFWHES
ncbi:thiazole synthase [Kineobactrum salinum]|uniref:Thiazole synthase n=1 Tax=Kineobactrum salinum TaxID=2708301 RepID=A0A6C0U300_9GAMM|nr:thiazole synthase [Kineobactrum salinum]QIB65347.1 thiazole synthase [Kineobactrum salinum]